jgi:hypothetical protein
MTTDKLTKHFDPAEWQWQDENGKVFRLDELSHNDLLQVACNCMDTIERAEGLAAKQQAVFVAWAEGKLPRRPR